MSDRCPFADSCWMGGGSYACVKTPPFCDSPLIPKENERPEIKVVPTAIGEMIQVTVPPPKLEIKAVSCNFDWEGKEQEPVFIETDKQANELLGTASPLSIALTEAFTSAIKQGELF